ncbi:uncharacterized protein LOC100888060 [Strongylocentrotus purpuratus]|uniref:Uncharacterized protein n=1 Tax=Strongylocentrotus purpuratus TaxID=7668 RepID=A0A7M7LPS9_STRPU|nr:uncharacterized protein LOC100888060 [Strongylocentrotus purpuratus]
MDICTTLIILFGIASSATGLRCYQCTSDQSGSGPCVDTPNTRNMQVVEDCKGSCYVSYSQSSSGSGVVTSRGCYSRKWFCLETCLGLFADINNCQHCCSCNNCNDITASTLGTFGDDFDCSATTPESTTTVAPSTTTVTTPANEQGEPLPRSQAWRMNMSWQILLIFALTTSMVIL